MSLYLHEALLMVGVCVCEVCFCLFILVSAGAGGYLANSLAIMTDAAHMLSDVTGFAVSLLAVWIALLPPTKRMPFGWHRAGMMTCTCVYIYVCAFSSNHQAKRGAERNPLGKWLYSLHVHSHSISIERRWHAYYMSHQLIVITVCSRV